jgi:DNA-binding transcriptional regulator YbjK
LDGDGFILQVHGVFTRIRSGLLWWIWVAARSDLQRRRRALAAILAKIYSKLLQLRRVKNPKGFGFYL